MFSLEFNYTYRAMLMLTNSALAVTLKANEFLHYDCSNTQQKQL